VHKILRFNFFFPILRALLQVTVYICKLQSWLHVIFGHLKYFHCQGRLWKQMNVEEYRASFEFEFRMRRALGYPWSLMASPLLGA
jgi:hypothetical protein